MSETVAPLRQTVSANGTSCDVRFGTGVLDRFGRDMRICAGRPGVAALTAQEGVDPGLVERIRRLATDAGFLVRDVCPLPAENAATLESANALLASLAAASVNASDVVVAVGDADALSVAAFCASTWCEGTAVACVATGLAGLVRCPARPRPLSVGECGGVVSARARMALCYSEPEVVDLAALTPANVYARALMVGAAVCESRDAFNNLVLASGAIAEGDLDALASQCLEAARSIGRIGASTSVGVRRSLTYGEPFAEALGALVPDAPEGLRLGEGLRFAARLAVGAVEGDVDFVFAQDALLERLGVAELPCRLDPRELGAAFTKAVERRSGRAMVSLPHAVGRVRPSTVPDDVLEEHLAAWCRARAALAAQQS